MASELRVNTLKDAAGSNEVAMTYVANGTAKAWVNFDGTGTIAARDSFNFSSLTDNGTGDYSVTITNAMSNNDFYGNTLQRGNGYAAGPNSSEVFTTTGVTTIEYFNGTSISDRSICGFMIMGDLA